jgi:uncharacterized coiled-coil DUF342 family protein
MDIKDMNELVQDKISNKIRIKDSSGDGGYDIRAELDENNNIVNAKHLDKVYKDLPELLAGFDELLIEHPENKEYYQRTKTEYQKGAQKAIEESKKKNEVVHRIAEVTKSLMTKKNSVIEELKNGGNEKYELTSGFIFIRPEHFIEEAASHKELFNYLYYNLIDSPTREEKLDELEKLIVNSK